MQRIRAGAMLSTILPAPSKNHGSVAFQVELNLLSPTRQYLICQRAVTRLWYRRLLFVALDRVVDIAYNVGYIRLHSQKCMPGIYHRLVEDLKACFKSATSDQSRITLDACA